MKQPLAIDLFCGLGGWTSGLLAEGYFVIGFDIEAHAYGEERYPGQLVIQDVMTLHGSQFKDAALIVASPPCQAYSYMAMPWGRAKAKAAAIRADESGQALKDLNALFNACFRIQREASEAAGRHIPMVVENVRGAEPWVGRAAWSYGSYYLFGDVPALMPIAIGGRKNPGFRFDGSGRSFQTESVDRHLKAPGGAHIRDGAIHTARLTNPGEGRKGCGRSLSEVGFNVSAAQRLASNADAIGYVRTEEDRRLHIGGRRKAASARIAKIPEVLSRHIGKVYRPISEVA